MAELMKVLEEANNNTTGEFLAETDDNTTTKDIRLMMPNVSNISVVNNMFLILRQLILSIKLLSKV